MQPPEDNNDAVLVPWEARQLGQAELVERIDRWAHPCPRIGAFAIYEIPRLPFRHRE